MEWGVHSLPCWSLAGLKPIVLATYTKLYVFWWTVNAFQNGVPAPSICLWNIIGIMRGLLACLLATLLILTDRPFLFWWRGFSSQVAPFSLIYVSSFFSACVVSLSFLSFFNHDALLETPALWLYQAERLWWAACKKSRDALCCTTIVLLCKHDIKEHVKEI